MPALYQVPRAKACQNCAVAKAKCEPAIGYEECKRCNKQNLKCVLRDPTARKRKRQGSSNGHGPMPSPSDAAPSFGLDELERGLGYYRAALFPYFPFVVPPDSQQRASDFAREKPFLSFVLAMLGCTEDRSRQCDLAQQSRAYLGTHVLQNGKKSLDLIQGLLVSSYWYHFQHELKSQRSIFMHLAMGMVVDLELNKSPFSRARLMTAKEADNGFDIQTDGVVDHTLEEKRTFLGCVYVSSVLSKASLNMDAIHFSEYAERCCDDLQKNSMHSDHSLVHLCRIQHIVERFGIGRSAFTQTRRARGFEFEFVFDVFRFQRLNQIDVLDFVRHWDQQLKEAWDMIPEIEKSQLLRIQYGYARVCLHECCLEESLFPSVEARLDVFQSCINAIRFLNDVFVPMSERPIGLLDVPSHVYAQSNHSIFVAIQIASAKCGNLSPEYIDSELNLSSIFEMTSERVGSVIALYPDSTIPAFYRRLVPMAKNISRWFISKKRAAERDRMNTSSDDLQAESAEELEFDFLGQFLNTDDSLWLQEFLSGDDHQSFAQ